MKIMKRKNSFVFLLILSSILLILSFSGLVMGGEIPSAYDVGLGKAPVPTIEEFTDGKVKEGDIIDKNNMDLIKDLLTPGLTKCLEMGMVMIMGKNTMAPYTGVPPAYVELSKKNKGKAIIDEHMTVWYEKKGNAWPGGLPFPEPQNVSEMIVAKKFGVPMDDFRMYGDFIYINEKGVKYKTQTYFGDFVWVQTRSTILPHLTPGYEKEIYRKLTCFTAPIEARGLGGINIRYYDDVATYDQGFYYHPAFKKTGRSNATTWMNNLGGSDITAGDGMGLQDPLVDWSFEYSETKYVMLPIIEGDQIVDNKGKLIKKVRQDCKDRFFRWKWAAFPFFVVEATPNIKHVYGRKTLYLLTPAYMFFTPGGVIPMFEPYDRQGELWKIQFPVPGCRKEAKTDTGNYTFVVTQGLQMYDLQSGHSTFYVYNMTANTGRKPTACSLKKLLAKGR